MSRNAEEKGRLFKAVMPNDPETVLFYVTNVEFSPASRRIPRLNSADGVLIGFASFVLNDLGDSAKVEYHVCLQIAIPSERAAILDKTALAEYQMQCSQSNADAIRRGIVDTEKPR